jgi:two-component system LytT family sensor kinase
VFAIAALAYRVLLAQGWPASPVSRLRVVGMHLLLGSLVLLLAPTALAFSAAFMDGRHEVLREQLANPLALSQMQIAGILRFWLPPYALGLALVALVHLARRYHRDSLQLATLSAKYASARLAMLSAQLQPHFLFNSLHAIAELVSESPARATEMIARLGDFLRHALDTSAQPWVSVETELAGLEAYLAVQRTRFGERLQVQMSIDPDALALTIPSLLLQPIVENAVEHGRAGPERSLVIDVRVRRTGLRLHIEIINSTPRLAEILPRSEYGNGLRNVDERLHAAYGDEAALAVGPDPLRGTLAALTTPAHVGLRGGWTI